SITKVSGRFPHARIIAVEMFRGPDHIARRIGGIISQGSRAVGQFASGNRILESPRSARFNMARTVSNCASYAFAKTPISGRRDGVFERKSLTNPSWVRIST